jgi:hypothetical protein
LSEARRDSGISAERMRDLVAVALCQVRNAISYGERNHSIGVLSSILGTPIRYIPGQYPARILSRSFPFREFAYPSVEICDIGHARKRACKADWSILRPLKYYLSYSTCISPCQSPGVDRGQSPVPGKLSHRPSSPETTCLFLPSTRISKFLRHHRVY